MSEHVLLIVGVLLAAIAAGVLLVWFFWLRPAKEEAVRLEPIGFADIEGWRDDDQATALQALLRSCRRTKASREASPCADALALAAQRRGRPRCRPGPSSRRITRPIAC